MKVPHDLLALELERTLHRLELTTKQGAERAGITRGEMKALLKGEVRKADPYLEALMALGCNLELACKAQAEKDARPTERSWDALLPGQTI